MAGAISQPWEDHCPPRNTSSWTIVPPQVPFFSAVHLSNLSAGVRIVLPYSITHCGMSDYPGDHLTRLLRDWVGLALTDKDLLDAAVLLAACRSVLRTKPGDQHLTHMALQYRQRSLQTLRQAVGVLSSTVHILNIAQAIALTIDEVRPLKYIRRRTGY